MSQLEKKKTVNKVNDYVVEVWFRYGKFEKDFELVELNADSDDEAVLIAKDLRQWVFSVNIISKNGIKNGIS